MEVSWVPERLREIAVVMTGKLCMSVAARLAQSVLKAQPFKGPWCNAYRLVVHHVYRDSAAGKGGVV